MYPVVWSVGTVCVSQVLKLDKPLRLWPVIETFFFLILFTFLKRHVFKLWLLLSCCSSVIFGPMGQQSWPSIRTRRGKTGSGFVLCPPDPGLSPGELLTLSHQGKGFNMSWRAFSILVFHGSDPGDSSLSPFNERCKIESCWWVLHCFFVSLKVVGSTPLTLVQSSS